jgi:anti-sigma regulatory factor (Ser/Thr protein kinase)
MERAQSKAIRQFIIENINKGSQDIGGLVEKKFGISRQAVNRHLHFLIEKDLIISQGNNRNRKYKLKPVVDKKFFSPVKKDLQEDVIWRNHIKPLVEDIPSNIYDICHYGVTEMVNNVIDHSAGNEMIIHVKKTAADISLAIFDNGVGIFKKIQTAFSLEDPSHTILELAKGKLTTDPARHTGEGIFFTSRMFDRFSIYSGKLYFNHSEIVGNRDWLLGFEQDDNGRDDGTLVKMEISLSSNRSAKEVFDKYSSENDDFGFTRTIVPVVLAKYGNENLISRSQAKRLLARLEKFREVIFDFEMVDTIGQAFADEIFRVFQSQNPHINLTAINTNEEVRKNISKALKAGSDPAP